MSLAQRCSSAALNRRVPTRPGLAKSWAQVEREGNRTRDGGIGGSKEHRFALAESRHVYPGSAEREEAKGEPSKIEEGGTMRNHTSLNGEGRVLIARLVNEA